MSVKLRMTLWVTFMVLCLCALVLTFVLVINSRELSDDPAHYLINVVNDNVDDVEYDNGRFEWKDLSFYRRGVYCSYYDANGVLLRSANKQSMDFSDTPFVPNQLRTVSLDGEDYYIYDVFVDMTVGGMWVRGVVSTASQSGFMHTILVLTASILPAILVLSFLGGLLITNLSFKPMSKIMDAADSINAGEDLSARINLERGPKEFKRMSSTFDGMFERLEKDFAAQKQFASDASHELRTPITVILAECDRAKRKAKTSDDYARSITVIEEQGEKMSQLVQELLSLTRMQQGTDRYPLREGDLSGFVTSCCEQFVPESERGIRLSLDIQPEVRASFNASLYSRLVVNLLQNAYKYGREGGNVLVSLKSLDGRAVLTVRDDGIGIDEANLDKIWNRFWQADTSRGADGGSGLGLAMVQEIAQFHGGTASVQSTLGKGSEFKVII